jgi:CheY-like chemotaxis protein
VHPPSNLRKPHDSDTTLIRAFQRGFPATQFPDFGLCGRSRILVGVFGALSPHPKIPFPAVGSGRGDDEAASRAAGADAFLVKPVSPTALATALLEATRRAAAAT